MISHLNNSKDGFIRQVWEKCFHFLGTSGCNTAKHNQPKINIQQKGEEKTEGRRGRRERSSRSGPQSLHVPLHRVPHTPPAENLIICSSLSPSWPAPSDCLQGQPDALLEKLPRRTVRWNRWRTRDISWGWWMVGELVRKAQALRRERHVIFNLSTVDPATLEKWPKLWFPVSSYMKGTHYYGL